MGVLGDKLCIVAYYIHTHLLYVHMYILPLYINEVWGDFRLVSSLISHERLGAVIRFQRFLPGRRASPTLQGYALGPAWQAYRCFPGAVQEIEGVSATGRRRGRGRGRGVRAPPQYSFGRMSSFSVGCLSGLRGPSALARVSQEVRSGPQGVQKLCFSHHLLYSLYAWWYMGEWLYQGSWGVRRCGVDFGTEDLQPLQDFLSRMIWSFFLCLG